VGDLFKHLLEVVEIVIVDAPPALTHFAGLALARHVGGVILVIEAERTRSSIVDQARRIIEMNGGRILGAVLNKRHLHIPRIIYQWL
jgi:protein-tyrosine kinase